MFFSPEYFFLELTLLALISLGSAAKGFADLVRRRRGEQHLDTAGIPVRARVVAVEPMQRELNGAAGHPVTVAFADGFGGERQVRLTSGLGGYVAREGTEVMVRLSPEDPHLLRAEAIVGPHGPYRVEPEPSHRKSLLPPLLLLVGVPLLAVTLGLAGWLTEGDLGQLFEDGAYIFVPGLFAVVGLILLISQLVVARRRRRLTAVASGVITEVWTERFRSSGGRSRGPRSNIYYRSTVHFLTPDGREVHRRSTSATSNQLEPGPVRVRYDPAHPPRFETGSTDVLGSVIGIGIGALFLVGGLVGTVIAVSIYVLTN